MHRLSFIAICVLWLIGSGQSLGAGGPGKHFDPSKISKPCSPCHAGHGATGTPMLARGDDELCLKCHDSEGARGGRQEALGLSQGARPGNIRLEMGKPASHPGARCIDCHSVHGVELDLPPPTDALAMGRIKPSTKRGFSSEAEMCLSCHGTRGQDRDDPADLARLFDPSNPSYHPVLSTGGRNPVPSLLAPLTSDTVLNCTDCHANDDPSGPRGPHGSNTQALLGNGYVGRQTGQPESTTTYALCYACHDRMTVLEQDDFPYHSEHVVGQLISCSECHNPHGASAAIALIRFNETTPLTGVSPSSSGRLGFISEGSGSGACFLTCHGVDHDPMEYGGFSGVVGLPFGSPMAAPGLRVPTSWGTPTVPNRVEPAPSKKRIDPKTERRPNGER